MTIQIITGFFLYGGLGADLPPAAVFIHRYSGLLACLFLLWHWIWCCFHPKLFKHLYPWNKKGYLKIKGEIFAVLKEKKLPAKGPQGGLPGFIEGLGVLTATGLALTGNTLPVILYYSGTITTFMHVVREIHIYIVPFFLAFYVGHVTMSIVNYFYQKSHHSKES